MEQTFIGRSRNTRQFRFKKESLLYGPQTEQSDTVLIHTRIWKRARSNNGYFLDISKIPKISALEHIQVLHQHYSSEEMSAALFLGNGTEKYLECYPNPSIVNTFTMEGVYYEQANTRLIPCKAIEGDGSVLEMNLLHLPMIETSKLAAGLQATLQQYGIVLDFGRLIDTTFEFFMGEGYATLYLPSNVPYPPLTHTLPFLDGDCFYITYPNMNTWCRYCHEEGHTKSKCQKAKEKTFCSGCDEYGHKREDCPRLQMIREKKMKRHQKPENDQLV